MTDRTPKFDAAVVMYEAVQKQLLDIIDLPDKSICVSEYRAKLRAALQAQQRAHKQMMEAWA